MLFYSPSSEMGRAYLLRSYNDIDIYVEDVAAQNAYVRLFQRMLGGIATITNVFPLHDRRGVIEACTADQGRGGRKRMYVIDGDFDHIRGIPPPALLRLYRLNAYCLENLLLSEAAAVELAMECATNKPSHQLSQTLNLRSLFEGAIQLLSPLFVVYAIAEHVGAGVPTTKFAVQRLLDQPSNPLSLSGHLIRKRLGQVRKAILAKIGLLAYRTIRQEFDMRMRGTVSERSLYISGKSYLLPLLHLHLCREVGFRGDTDSLKVRLAARCELEVDGGLRRAVQAAAA